VLGSVHSFPQAAHAANTYRPRFQVKARASYTHESNGTRLQLNLYTILHYTILYGVLRKNGGSEGGSNSVQ